MGHRLEDQDIHWAYFLALEEDLYRLSRFVDLSERNYESYSIECTRLLLASCSEVEVVLKLASGLGKGKHLRHCFAALGKDTLPLTTCTTLVRRSGLAINPWEGWTHDDEPFWWSAYNAVKHDRSRSYDQANLRNALYAVCGLFAATLLCLRRKGADAVFPAPRLLLISGELGTHYMEPSGPVIGLKG